MGISKLHFRILHSVDSVRPVSSLVARSGSQPSTQYRGQIGLKCSEHVFQGSKESGFTVSLR